MIFHNSQYLFPTHQSTPKQTTEPKRNTLRLGGSFMLSSVCYAGDSAAEIADIYSVAFDGGGAEYRRARVERFQRFSVGGDGEYLSA